MGVRVFQGEETWRSILYGLDTEAEETISQIVKDSVHQR